MLGRSIIQTGRRIGGRMRGVPPQIAVGLILVGVIGASAAILFWKQAEPKADAMAPPRAARLERIDGSVSIAQTLAQGDRQTVGQDGGQLDWRDASVNAPVTVGDRIVTHDNSRASIALSGRDYARLNPGAQLDVLSLADLRTQLALRDGSCVFDVGELKNGELFEVATPDGAVDFAKPGLYQIAIDDAGDTTVSVLSGLAEVVGPNGSSEIKEGDVLTLAGQAVVPADNAPPASPRTAVRSRIASTYAGELVNDYYAYRYPRVYDGRYQNYESYLADPYYDPYTDSASYQYLSEDIPGGYDLDRYGDWQDVTGYGRCWIPRVAADWAPYRDGYWDVDDVWGAAWVSDDPWGYAPYHYGRWAYVNQQRWAWVPEDCVSHPVYAPALVAFVPVQQTQIAWVPLGPGEPYVARYYDGRFEPRYFGSRQVIRNCVNLNYPAAVTVVPVQAFAGRISPRVTVPANPEWFRRAQPVIDPFAVGGVRQVATQEVAERRQARRELRAANSVAPVVTSVAPIVPPVGANTAQALRFQPVPDKQRKARMEVQNNDHLAVSQRPGQPPNNPAIAPGQTPQNDPRQRDERIQALRARVRQGDTSARQELRTLKRERRQESSAVPTPPPSQQSGQAAAPDKQQRRMGRMERQQQAAQQPQAANQQAQANQQRRAEKQLERQQRQQAQAQQQQQQRATAEQQIQARRQQKQQAQQQRAQQAAAQQAQANQQRQQRQQEKAQRNANRPPRQNQQPQPQAAQIQQREAMKAQRRSDRQQQQQQMMMMQQRAAQQSVQQQAERNRALRQQQRQEIRPPVQQPAPRPFRQPQPQMQPQIQQTRRPPQQMTQPGMQPQMRQMTQPPAASRAEQKAARRAGKQDR